MADDTTQVDLVVKRLEKIERQNRRFKQVGLGVALALGTLLLMGQARPQLQDAIALGRARLSIGMPREAAIAELTEDYQVQNEGNNTWLVTAKGGGSPAFASVDLENEKVKEARKYWSPNDQQKGAEFATAIYGLIASFSQEGRRNCTISTDESHDPGFDNQRAVISCGHKSIEISITRAPSLAGPSAEIDEVLR
jgi:hypothetical protein